MFDLQAQPDRDQRFGGDWCDQPQAGHRGLDQLMAQSRPLRFGGRVLDLSLLNRLSGGVELLRPRRVALPLEQQACVAEVGGRAVVLDLLAAADPTGNPAQSLLRLGLNGCTEKALGFGPAPGLSGIDTGVVEARMAEGSGGNPLGPSPMALLQGSFLKNGAAEIGAARESAPGRKSRIDA